MRKLNQLSLLFTGTKQTFLEMQKHLASWGTNLIFFPTIETKPDFDIKLKNDVLKSLKDFDWIIFSSPNAATIFFDTFDKDLINKKKTNIGSIGPSTTSVLENFSIKIAFTGSKYDSHTFSKEFISTISLENKKILLPRSHISRNIILNELKKTKAAIFDFPLYKTVLPEIDPGNLKKIKILFETSRIDWIIFTSPSSVDNFYKIFEPRFLSNKNFKIASIGPITSKSIFNHGASPDIEANDYHISGILDQFNRL